MVQKIHPWGVIWVSSIHPRVGRLSEKNDDLAVQYEDVHGYCKGREIQIYCLGTKVIIPPKIKLPLRDSIPPN